MAALLWGHRAAAQHVSLSLKNVPLEKAFQEIKRQTGYTFAYTESMLKKANPVTVECKNVTLEQALTLCFGNQPFTYTIIEKTVVVKPKETHVADNAANLSPPGQIKGRIFGESAPLKGASVESRKTHKGISTDDLGNFELNGLPEGDTLVASFIGYQTMEVPTRQAVNGLMYISMKLAVNTLDELQIVAYGTTTQRYTVGSIATVSSQDIESQPVMNPLDALAGRVAGLQVISTSGAPGSMTMTQIRGQNTLPTLVNGYITQGTFNQPLYIIDGIPYAAQNNNVAGFLQSTSAGPSSVFFNNPYGGLSPLNSINPMDIESISVLKDADATAIYGSRGANGVILINTKKGKMGKTSLNVSINTGPTKAGTNVTMMNTQQYLQMRREALKNDGRAASLNNLDFDLLLFDSTKNTNWYKQLLGETAQHTDVHVGLSGGIGTVTYSVGAGYTKSGFNYPGNFSDQRYSLNSDVTIRSTNNKLTLDIVSGLSYDDNKNSSGIGTSGLINLPPNFPDMVDSKGNLVWYYQGYTLNELSGNKSNNYYAQLRQPFQSQDYMLNQSLRLNYSLFKGLSFETTAGYSRLESKGYSATPIAAQTPAYGTVYGTANFQNDTKESIDIEPQLRYNRTFGRAKLDVLAGGTYEKDITGAQYISGGNYTNDALLNSLSGASSFEIISSGLVDKYVAGFGRANLVWNSRYILNLTGNIDGSSLFGPGHRFGEFGSAGAGWIFTEEQWSKRTMPWLSFGKLTADYGITGSNNVTPYAYQPNWTAYGSLITYQGSMVYTPNNLYDPNFHWATKHDISGNLTLGFFNNWLLINVGSYLNWTGDQLLPSPLPAQAGFAAVTQNAPFTLQNSGWEVTITAGNTHLQGSDRNKFIWFAPSFNIARNYNKVTRVDPNSTYAAVYRKGFPGSAAPFVKYIGVDSATGLFDYLKADGKTVTNLPNQLSTYQYGGDANQMISLVPTVNFGFSDGFSWKGFSVNFHGLFVKQKGMSYLRGLYAFNGSLMSPGYPSSNMPALILGKEWRQPGDHATIQKFSSNLTSSGQVFQYSTGVITDASYLRFDNLAISYQVPARWMRKLGMTNCVINLTGHNLFTITPYKVGDPATQSIYNIPLQRVFSGGVNLTF
ncbi:SusC/RagA family TonB-linked outer membrane protein [Dinghuibacter silviterrae]|nr:SusC/RagA family TonB-linked outer membrane protein [Dinghuibacter silviterrae]